MCKHFFFMKFSCNNLLTFSVLNFNLSAYTCEVSLEINDKKGEFNL